MTEIWKPIPGYEGHYEVSSEGRVESLNYNKTKVRKIIKQGDNRGYLGVELNVRGDAKRFTVHRLVMLAFVGPRPEGYQINHINGIKTDNRLENLEYCTASENQKHSFRLGLQSNKGEKHSQAKFTDTDILQIRHMLKEGFKQSFIAAKFNVNRSTISFIKSGRNWAHVLDGKELL